jgi:hypothetical protein
MCFSAPKIPAPPKQPQPEDAMTAALRERQKRAGGLGFGSTILGGSMGTSSASTAPKSLLGQ